MQSPILQPLLSMGLTLTASATPKPAERKSAVRVPADHVPSGRTPWHDGAGQVEDRCP